MVISILSLNGIMASIPSSILPIPAALIKLGVPPPIKIECNDRWNTRGNSLRKSASRSAMYSSSGILPFCVCELKSQYGHFCTHHGICTYKLNGGSRIGSVVTVSIVVIMVSVIILQLIEFVVHALPLTIWLTLGHGD